MSMRATARVRDERLLGWTGDVSLPARHSEASAEESHCPRGGCAGVMRPFITLRVTVWWCRLRLFDRLGSFETFDRWSDLGVSGIAWCDSQVIRRRSRDVKTRRAACAAYLNIFIKSMGLRDLAICFIIFWV